MGDNSRVTENPYAPEQDVRSLSECDFYHSMDLPGVGSVSGQWDLRGHVEEYLGGVSMAGKRVLDVGTASGFLCFEMERLGADAVGFDLADGVDWDVVPYGGGADPVYLASRHELIERLHRSWWLSWRAFGSRAKVAYGTIYDIPDSLGRFDIAVVGCLLLHLRDPFRALEIVARRVDETLIVTDVVPGFLSARTSGFRPPSPGAPPDDAPPTLTFLPSPGPNAEKGSWWWLSPSAVGRFLRVLGFDAPEVRYHVQRFGTREIWLYTVVGRRSGGPAPPSTSPSRFR